MKRNVRDQAEWLAGRLDGMDKKIAGLRSQGDLAFSSIEDGAIVEKDLDGNLVSSVGKQHDGSHVQVPYVGPVPATPVAPVLSAVPGVVQVRWNGKFVDDAVSAMDFKHVAVHVGSTSVVDTTPSTQVATIRGELGDVATVTAPEGILYVVLVAWSEAGKASAPSAVTAVNVPAPADGASLNGKITVATHAPELADGEGKPDNALWNQIDPDTGAQVAVWRWDGVAWVGFPITEMMLPLVNIAEGTYGRLQGVQLEADAINGMVITGSVIQSPGEGAGYQLTVDGYTSRDYNGNVTVFLPADGSPAQFRGDIEARSLTATGRVSFQAPENEVGSGASLMLESGVSAPISAPSVGAAYEVISLPLLAVGESASGLAFADGMWWRVIDAGAGNDALDRFEGISASGAVVRSFPLPDFWARNGVTAIGSELFFLGRRDDLDGDARNGTRWVKVYGVDGSFKRQWQYASYGSGTYQPGIGSDGTDLLIAQSWATGLLSWRRYNKTNGEFMGTVNTTLAINSDVVGIYQGSADFGQERVVVSKPNGDTVAFTPAGSIISYGGWPSASGLPAFGPAWAAGRFWQLQQAALIGYSTIAAPSGEGVGDADDWWVAHTWTGAGGAETSHGPPTRFKFLRRSELQVSAGMVPPGVTGAKFYLARKTTTPTRVDLHLIATITGSSGRVATMPANWQTLPTPPSANTFPNASPGTVKSRLGTFEVKGDGSGKWGPLIFNADGSMTSSAVPDWVPLTSFSAGFSVGNFGYVPAYRVWPDGKVEFRGVVNGTMDIAKVIAVLPAGARPSKSVNLVAATSANSYAGPMRMEFSSTANPNSISVYPQGVTRVWVCLDGLSYYLL